MFKKPFSLFLSIIVLLAITYLHKTPIFKDYSSDYEVCLGNGYSRSQIVTVEKREFFSLDAVYGESFKTQADGFCIYDFLNDFDATVIFTEVIEQGRSYYAYSPKIKYRASVNGYIVNLQVFVGAQITVGTPIIFGSF